MNAANLKKDSLPSNSELCEARSIEDLVKQVQEKGDFLEKVFGALISTKHPHISMSDNVMIALQNPEIYHALNFLFENPLNNYQCFNNAFHHLQFSEMVHDVKTPWGDVVRAFAEIKDSLLSAHLNAAKSNF